MSIPEFEVYMHLKMNFFFYGHPVSFLFDSPFPAQQVVGPALFELRTSSPTKTKRWCTPPLALPQKKPKISWMLQLGK